MRQACQALQGPSVRWRRLRQQHWAASSGRAGKAGSGEHARACAWSFQAMPRGWSPCAHQEVLTSDGGSACMHFQHSLPAVLLEHSLLTWPQPVHSSQVAGGTQWNLETR